jgi:hypothetical protein
MAELTCPICWEKWTPSEEFVTQQVFCPSCRTLVEDKHHLKSLGDRGSEMLGREIKQRPSETTEVETPRPHALVLLTLAIVVVGLGYLASMLGSIICE